jgi:hypothetical protein
VGTPRWRQPGAVGSSQRRPNSSGGRREFEIAASTRSDRLARHGTARSPAQAPTPSIGTQKTPSRCFYIVAMQYNHNSVSLNAQESIVARVGGADLSDQVTTCRRRVAEWKLQAKRRIARMCPHFERKRGAMSNNHVSMLGDKV